MARFFVYVGSVVVERCAPSINLMHRVNPKCSQSYTNQLHIVGRDSFSYIKLQKPAFRYHAPYPSGPYTPLRERVLRAECSGCDDDGANLDAGGSGGSAGWHASIARATTNLEVSRLVSAS